jgi:hypothetical protein
MRPTGTEQSLIINRIRERGDWDAGTLQDEKIENLWMRDQQSKGKSILG